MEKNKFLLSIIKCPSFNLLAFQAFTFVIMIIAGAAGAFQFVPFFGLEGISMYYFYFLHFVIVGSFIYTLIIFVTGCVIKKVDNILFSKNLIIFNCLLYYIIFSIFILIYHIPPETVPEKGTFWLTLVIMFGCILCSAVICTIVPYIITLIVEQVRGIRLKILPYFKTPLRMCAVVIPAVIYIFIILITVISFFIMRYM